MCRISNCSLKKCVKNCWEIELNITLFWSRTDTSPQLSPNSHSPEKLGKNIFFLLNWPVFADWYCFFPCIAAFTTAFSFSLWNKWWIICLQVPSVIAISSASSTSMSNLEASFPFQRQTVGLHFFFHPEDIISGVSFVFWDLKKGSCNSWSVHLVSWQSSPLIKILLFNRKTVVTTELSFWDKI